MADQTAKVAVMGRYLAITHIIVGVLLFCFGIADYVTQHFWTGYVCFGIWIGIWMCITGGLGIPGTQRDPSSSRNVFASIFMGFSITSAVLGGIIIICYSIAIAIYSDYFYYARYSHNTDMALAVITLILGIVEFAIGIWAAVCCCIMQICCCGAPPQQGQVMYTANTGYAVAQVSGGHVAVPMQTAGGMVAVQTVSQGGQPQMVMMPASGVVGGQPQFVQVPASGATVGTQPHFVQVASPGAAAPGYQPQQVDVPPSYGQGQYMPLQDEQIPVKT
ncbi:uncharacterized protein LOC113664683 [Pocillopora damicornis]|nr:uncharacterized protein LOC113664683 [Pocillopora damicornis]